MSWMEGQLQNNQEALTNAVRSYAKSQADVGKKLTKRVMADQQHMEDAKSFYMQQAMTAIKTPEMPEPERTEEGAMVAADDEEAEALAVCWWGQV